MNVTNLSSVGNEAVGIWQKTKALRAVRYNGNYMQSIKTATETDSQYPESTLCQLPTANCLLKFVAFGTVVCRLIFVLTSAWPIDRNCFTTAAQN